MSIPQKTAIDKMVSKPQSLEAERSGNAFFLDEYTPSIPNESNFLTLMTMRQFYKGDQKTLDIFDKIAREENRYLMKAMEIITEKHTDPTTKEAKVQDKIHNKLGRDFNAALKIAAMLKNKTDENEMNELLKPLTEDLIREKGSRSFGGSRRGSESGLFGGF